MPQFSENSEKEPRDASFTKERELSQQEQSAGTSPPRLSEDSSETEETALLTPDLDSEVFNAKELPRVESLENTPDKDKDALSTEREPTDGLDADGARSSKVPRLPDHSERVPQDATSGNSEKLREPSAGATNPESSEDSSETEEDALSGERQEHNG